MSGYTEWRKEMWKLAVKHPAKLNKRQNRVRHRLAYRIRQAILKSYEDY